jgi:multiple sugar transport system substrate-binding protein
LNRMQILINAFANVAGGQIPQVAKALTVNGRINYDSDAMKSAFALFKQLYDDGSIHPDTVNLSAPEAREYFAQGEAAFLMQGNWCISAWDATYPDMNYGVMAVPVPDDGAKGHIAAEEPAPWMGIYKNSKHPQAAADYLMALYAYTEGYQYQQDLVGKAGQLSIVKGMVEEHLSNENSIDYYNLANETSMPIPSATIRDINVYEFYSNVVDVQPGIGNLFQGLISGGLDDYESALTTLSDQLTEEWKRAAQETGIDFSVFEFPNWDPMKAYTAEDYNELQ